MSLRAIKFYFKKLIKNNNTWVHLAAQLLKTGVNFDILFLLFILQIRTYFGILAGIVCINMRLE